MTLFYGLVIAHLIADFMQPASLVRWSKQHWAGLVVHALIYTFISALILIGAPNFIFWILVLGLSHYIIDRIKYRVSPLFPKSILPIFLLDQALHITIILTVTFCTGAFKINNLSLFEKLVGNYASILPYIVGYIVATFSTSILIFEVDRTIYARKGIKNNAIITFKERLVGMLERALAVTVILIYPFFFLFPFTFFYSLTKTINEKKNRDIYIIDFLVSVFSTLLIALLLLFS